MTGSALPSTPALSNPASSPASQTIDLSRFPVVERRLPNGMEVRLLRDTTVPTVTYYTFFRVGSRNERPGITGISHLFEHMMFNGSAKFGPKEFDRQLESRGGTSNAYTSTDMTAYYEDFDRDALPLVVDLESDRMRALQINDTSLASEREVVKEERRFRVDNDIGGRLDEQLDALAYQAHPYHWPVIGWMGDLDRISRTDCEQYFRTYYAPNNAVLVVVGDIDVESTWKLISDHYATIPAGPPIPVVPADEPPQLGERRAQVHHPAQAPVLALGYRAVPVTHPDAPVLDVIQTILSAGEGARLQRTLVRQAEVVTNVGAYFEWKIDLGLFKATLELPPGAKPAKALAAFDTELAKLGTDLVSETELSRAKNILRGQLLRGLGTHNGLAHSMGEHEVHFGSWKTISQTFERYAAVTPADIQRVAKQYLVPAQRTVIELVPTAPE